MIPNLRGIHKFGHMTRAIQPPITKDSPTAKDEEAYTKWEDDDGFVISIIFRVMTDEV